MTTPSARPHSLENTADSCVTWRYFAPVGVTLEQVMAPDYWRHHIRELGQQRIAGRHAWNKIEVLAEDGSWEATLRVLSINSASLEVYTRCISEWKASARPGRKPALPDGFSVEHVSGNGWRAVDQNGHQIASHLPTEEDAIRAASSRAKKVAA